MKPSAAFVLGFVLGLFLFTLCVVSHARAADVTLDYGEFKNMVSQCHSCKKAVAAYKLTC